jgi:site-specific recombinase XerD
MKLHGYSEKTIKSYTSCVQAFSHYFLRSPLFIQKNEIEDFFLHLRTAKKSDSTIHIYYESLKYFYKMHNQLNRLPKISFPRINNKIPVILSKKEVQSLINNSTSLKYKTIITIIYSAGLRISEATNLKLSDIDFERKTIFIRNSKNKKDRYSILANETINLLNNYLQVYKPVNYLFYSNDIWNKISTDCIQKYFKRLLVQCRFDKSIHIHTLRHCFATHLLEDGTSIFYIMNLLGHSNIQTTMVYLHMQSLDKLSIKSPIDSMSLYDNRASDGETLLFLESA